MVEVKNVFISFFVCFRQWQGNTKGSLHWTVCSSCQCRGYHAM